MSTTPPKAIELRTLPQPVPGEEPGDGADCPDALVTPKMKLLCDNIRFVLESKKVYLDKTISLIKLSQMLFTNTTYLSKVVNRFWGCNLKTLLNGYRIEHAKQLLKNENYPVNDLPARCGFVSRSTFYAAFMKFEQMTPTDYRTRVRTEALRAEAVAD